MTCKRCKKDIEADSVYCRFCGSAQVRDKKKKMYQRPDGLFEKVIVIDGKRVPFRAKTETEVYRKMAEYKGSVEAGPLFKEVAEKWYGKLESSIEFSTIYRCYKAPYKYFLNVFEGKRIKDIIPSDITSVLNKLSDKDYTTKTIRQYYSIVNLILSEALTDGIIKSNPANGLRIPKGKRSEKRKAPTREQIETITKSIDCTFGAFALFLLFTGCRCGEALALQFKDIDKKNKTVTINKAAYFDSSRPKIKDTKTEKGIRIVALPDIVLNTLPDGKPDLYVFSDNGTDMYTSNKLRYKWKEYQKQSGIDLTPHQLRHGYASILHDIGITPKEAQQLLGHANIAVTMDIYTHVDDSVINKANKKLNQYTKNTQKAQKRAP